MPKYTRTDIKRQVLTTVVAWLERESQTDIDDPEFIDKAFAFQLALADELKARIP